jgi:hypothetical protein
MSAERISEKLGNIRAASVTSAIGDFRNQCRDKMRSAGWECGKNDIIETVAGGGYRIKEWVSVREGLDEQIRPQIEADADQILKLFSAHLTRTRKQINDGVDFQALRVKSALARLTETKRLKHVSGSGATTTYELEGSA